jgi:hypothetical protein
MRGKHDGDTGKRGESARPTAVAGLLEQEQAMPEARWYAAYTCANHRKRAAAELGVRDVEHFLPLYSSVRRWKDRRVQLELPLFPGYIFVRLALCDRLRVVQIPSVVRLDGFGRIADGAAGYGNGNYEVGAFAKSARGAASILDHRAGGAGQKRTVGGNAGDPVAAKGEGAIRCVRRVDHEVDGCGKLMRRTWEAV